MLGKIDYDVMSFTLSLRCGRLVVSRNRGRRGDAGCELNSVGQQAT
jgi:hypothetical protein